ncbi:WxL domain-containing protein [Enterococcus sp. S52]|nr:WxL domain-containing protein [Enterococcus sp. S52]MBK0071871.1 WxL domain-containing protein [Enterococcus sp. S53]MBK0142463.1 WxL domain-containing protein [Enterococcus sp. S76]MBK0146158.1 WxL domain-containing protein [Enterococcus sp. S77]
MNSSAQLTVRSTLAKRGILFAGNNAQLLVNNSELSVTSATQASININGARSSFSSENSTIQLVSTTGTTTNVNGESPQIVFDSSMVNITSTTGRGVYLQGTDALLSLSNKSELAVISEGAENIQIGANTARPELLVTGESKLSVTTTSATASSGLSVIHLLGSDPKTTVIGGSTLEILSNANRGGLRLDGVNPELLVTDSQVYVTTVSGLGVLIQGDNQKVVLEGSNTTLELTSFSGMNLQSRGTLDQFEITNGATVNGTTGDAISFFFENTGTSQFNVRDEARLNLSGAGSGADSSVLRFFQYGNYQFNIDGGHIDIYKTGGIAPAIRMVGGNNTINVENGGSLDIRNVGNGTPADGTSVGANQGIYYSAGGGNGFTVQDPGSKVRISSDNGPAIHTMGGAGYIRAANLGHFEASGRTASENSGVFESAGNLTVELDNPLFLDFTNYRPNGGGLFTVQSASTLTATNSDLAVWKNGTDLTGDPDLNFRKLDYSFTGTNYNTLSSTSDPDQINTDIFGTRGLTSYTRMSSNNGRWAIADELRVPTNADKKIHGRVSLPVGLDNSRPAWEGEAIVTVEVESPSSESTQEYTAKTVGDTNESPGISIYGEEPRGGLFEIDLDEPLEAGSKVRISKVELTSGELTDGFEHQILTDTVEVFPIIPPTPAQFSSAIIAQDSTLIQGMTDNLDAEVTATHNGEALDTENVQVDTDGRFTIDVSDVPLEMDDEIQVFLRDAKGSAEEAGIINPPETNNDRGNINPATELPFHDVVFEPATTLVVGDLGPVSPVDPLEPETEVDPENKPELPEDQGMLSIDFASSFQFGEQSISTQDKTYYAKPQRLLNADGTINEAEERPNYVQISDRRTENDRNGWQLAVTQQRQFHTQEGHELDGASIQFTNQQLATAQGGEEPELLHADLLTLVPGMKQPLVSATGNSGTGTWIYRFGDRESANESVVLEVPSGTSPETKNYSTTLIWELSSVPDNN